MCGPSVLCVQARLWLQVRVRVRVAGAGAGAGCGCEPFVWVVPGACVRALLDFMRVKVWARVRVDSNAGAGTDEGDGVCAVGVGGWVRGRGRVRGFGSMGGRACFGKSANANLYFFPSRIEAFNCSELADCSEGPAAPQLQLCLAGTRPRPTQHAHAWGCRHWGMTHPLQIWSVATLQQAKSSLPTSSLPTSD